MEVPLPIAIALLDRGIADGWIVEHGDGLDIVATPTALSTVPTHDSTGGTATGPSTTTEPPETLGFSPSLIRAMHAQIARRLAIGHADPRRIGRHWLAATAATRSTFTDETLAAQLRSAAESVRPASLPQSIELLRASINATPDSNVRVLRETELATLALLGGHLDEAAAVCARTLGPGPGPLSAVHEIGVRGVRAVVHALRGPNYAADALADFTRVEELLDADPEGIDVSEVAMLRADSVAGRSIVEVYRGNLDSATVTAHQAIELGKSSGSNSAVSRAHETLALVALAIDRSDDARRHAAEAVAWSGSTLRVWAMVVPAHLTAALVAIHTETPARAVEHCVDGLAVSEHNGHLLGRLYLLSSLAAFQLVSGDVTAAARSAALNNDLVLTHCPSHPTPVTSAILGFEAACRGDNDAAIVHAEKAAGELFRSGAQLAIADVAVWLIAQVFEAVGRPADARTAMTLLWDALGESTGAVVISADLVRLSVGEPGDPPARALRIRDVLRARAADSGTTRVVLASRRVDALLARDCGELCAVAEAYSGAGAQLTAAWCLADAVRAAVALGDPSAAESAARRATRAFNELNAPAFEAQVRAWVRPLGIALRPLRRTPTASEARFGLTQIESVVARLAASGMTNRQIAEQCHISPRTVESHLGRVYTKTGVRNRVELASTFNRP